MTKRVVLCLGYRRLVLKSLNPKPRPQGILPNKLTQKSWPRPTKHGREASKCSGGHRAIAEGFWFRV